jgi:hypothetical protein
MKLHPFHHYPSTYLALVVWGAAGFMAQPTIASFVVHFLGIPLGLALILWIAHYEGRSSARETGTKVHASG